MTFKVFIDGRHGTTGLKIDERLAARKDVEILAIPEDKRKDPAVKAEYINAADIVFLCLPDAASKESVSLLAAGNTRTRFLDASTAHRTNPDWVYGLPELHGQREKIRHSQRIAVPGCHATGFILQVTPLVADGTLPADHPLTCTSLTGYSGGGKEMIADYETHGSLGQDMLSPRIYALGLGHKHLPEMAAISGLTHRPLFSPVVGPFAQGMLVSVPLLPRLLPGKPSPQDIHTRLAAYYANEACVKVMPLGEVPAGGFLPATACNDTNRAELFVFGHEEQILLVARFDNLGKGASGAAIQCMNIALGCDELTGLQA
ncbi:MAG: N-acetyl-gamma-glutamyl-phosphate reductase [Candidatus Dactylopiibacterium carminicum]|uniref:N-acetyl-gamma-glutamyl-phosphate reductase n=1 Tax=Candidatus Dactylopiibacterium carminicum TaxID=857335 RepID=A0A272EX63_9RHOO|nr:N-acetyl-gamma-glutamyl-phosphate reductase [Candidatus Dactylopiibacterium carminicum]KAF7600266.1 N-acetyl-gamma-glutamyl-phosphate reductase [Candidatus Dactylopiibacterium carminicum]PAS94681.1 MAG: N-acetyl-gamma-glutamyl-phosphate reductase [Candidatus Dactylopiibacterium carminicum]PAT00265.1 MAG: N-acetyl-gamma-glutamyl-phosphate reductase [Candidatus Dactylopiibacterium carminicum]